MVIIGFDDQVLPANPKLPSVLEPRAKEAYLRSDLLGRIVLSVSVLGSSLLLLPSVEPEIHYKGCACLWGCKRRLNYNTESSIYFILASSHWHLIVV